MIERSVLEAALDKIRPGLDADGFSLRAGAQEPGSTVQVVLVARPGACTDCLVPEDVIVAIIQQAIGDLGTPTAQVKLLKEGFEDLLDH